jgi:hypothetical protein
LVRSLTVNTPNSAGETNGPSTCRLLYPSVLPVQYPFLNLKLLSDGAPLPVARHPDVSHVLEPTVDQRMVFPVAAEESPFAKGDEEDHAS